MGTTLEALDFQGMGYIVGREGISISLLNITDGGKIA